jgi:hypothetical protein
MALGDGRTIPTAVEGLAAPGAGRLADRILPRDFRKTFPRIVRAEGIRLFRDAREQHTLRITEATVLGGGMLALRMAPARAEGTN